MKRAFVPSFVFLLCFGFGFVFFKLGSVAHTFDPSSRDAEAGGSL